MKKLLLPIILLISTCTSFAQQSKQAVRVNLGVFYASKRVYRGALIWDAPIIAAGPSFVFLNAIALGQGGLSVFKRIGDFHTLTLGATYFDDNEPSGPVIKLKSSSEDFKNKRGSTYGSYFKYSFRFKQFISYGIEFHKDLKRHKGNYLNLKLATSVIPFFTIGANYGLGDKSNNRYVYGPDAKSGSGHVDYFTNLILPFLPWNGRLMLNYTSSKIIQAKNKEADFIRGQDHQQIFSVATLWSF